MALLSKQPKTESAAGAELTRTLNRKEFAVIIVGIVFLWMVMFFLTSLYQ